MTNPHLKKNGQQPAYKFECLLPFNFNTAYFKKILLQL
jgi:hypothetical protein